MTIESKVAGTILQKPVLRFVIGGKEYEVASPSIATLILVSELVSEMPNAPRKIDGSNVINFVLHNAKDYRKLGTIAAVLILGAKRVMQTNWVRFCGIKLWKKRRSEAEVLGERLLEDLSPKALFDIVVEILKEMEISAFFGITTSLSEVNLVKATKEVVD